MIKVSIDAAGGDYGYSVTVLSGINTLIQFSELFIYFVGDEVAIQQILSTYPQSIKVINRFKIIHTNEVVTMSDKPSIALRSKKSSSMRIAINLVKDNTVDACVSGGNTGALMAISRFVLKTITGVNRPAIMSKMPAINGYTYMLDLGANIDSSPKDLLEFAVMASIAVSEIEQINTPTIGLLNIGEEEVKGNDKIKKTAELLKKSSLNYYGFIEGDDIYKPVVNIVLCDGFEGNIALKASEGAVKLIINAIKVSFNKNIITKLVAYIAQPILKNFKNKIDPSKYNGAYLLGLKGLVIKSHGGADVTAFTTAIKHAIVEVKAGITNKITTTVISELNKIKNNE